MPRSLDGRTARDLVGIVEALGNVASFSSVLRKAILKDVLKDHKTLRRYLDLLVRGEVLSVRLRDVGSVNPQQLYSVRSNRPRITVGLAILREHGLDWDVPRTDLRSISTDFEALVRSKNLDNRLMASLEDCLAVELHHDAKKSTGTASLAVALLSTKKVDLPYLLRRADQLNVGKAMRIILRRILEVLSSDQTEVDGTAFLAVRNRFLTIARQYSQSGFWRMVEHEIGVGNFGISIADNLTESDIVGAAGKQLGVLG